MASHVLISGLPPVYGEALASALIPHFPETRIVALPSVLETMDRIQSTKPSVILLDVRYPSSQALLPIVRKSCPDAGLVVLGIAGSRSGLLECIRFGVAGFIGASGTMAEVVAALKRVLAHEAFCSASLTGDLLRELAARDEPASALLTPREIEIVSLIDRGASNREIAGRLQIELATVKNHVHNILEKLRVRRRGEAAARYRGYRQSGLE